MQIDVKTIENVLINSIIHDFGIEKNSFENTQMQKNTFSFHSIKNRFQTRMYRIKQYCIGPLQLSLLNQFQCNHCHWNFLNTIIILVLMGVNFVVGCVHTIRANPAVICECFSWNVPRIFQTKVFNKIYFNLFKSMVMFVFKNFIYISHIQIIK